MAFWEVNDTSTRLYPPGYWHWHAWKMKEVATREALPVASTGRTDTP